MAGEIEGDRKDIISNKKAHGIEGAVTPLACQLQQDTSRVEKKDIEQSNTDTAE